MAKRDDFDWIDDAFDDKKSAEYLTPGAKDSKQGCLLAALVIGAVVLLVAGGIIGFTGMLSVAAG